MENNLFTMQIDVMRSFLLWADNTAHMCTA